MNQIMLNLKYLFIRIREKVYERLMIFKVTETNVGFKFINVLLIRPTKKNQTKHETTIVKPEQLYLSIDFLKDQYTLLGCNIKDSPHFFLMKALMKGDDISNTDYIQRVKRGTLDTRFLQNNIDSNSYIDCFKKRKIEIENGDISPILVYKINGKFYIKDGKHRAALCALLDRPIFVIQLDPNSMIEGVGERVFSEMNKKKAYSKHFSFYSEMIKLNYN